MKVRRIKYEKYANIVVDGNNTTLIEYLGKIRSEKHICKNKISQIIKGNIHWYSQLERDGKNGDDNRRKYIDEQELIQLVSIIIFGVDKREDLSKYRAISKSYIDTLNLNPIDSNYKFFSQIPTYVNDEEQFNQIDLLLNSVCNSINDCVRNISHSNREDIINYLKNFNRTLKHNPIFALQVAGLEFAPIFDQSTAILSNDFLNKIRCILDKNELENKYLSPEELGEDITKCYNDYMEKSGHLFNHIKNYDIKF